MGRKFFSFIGLSILGTGKTLATFQVSGNISLSLDELIIQLNSCNSNSRNSKDHLNGTNSSVPSEFTGTPLQENSFNSNSHNSKNHLHRINF